MTRAQIRELALSMGFKLKKQPNGELDLNPYVYDFAVAVIRKARDHVREKTDPEGPSGAYDLELSDISFRIEKEGKNQ